MSTSTRFMQGSETGVLSIHGWACYCVDEREQGTLRSDSRLMPACRGRLEITVCLWAGTKDWAKVKFWHQKPFWDVIHKLINVWSSVRKMVAEFKRLQMALDTFDFYLYCDFPFRNISTREKRAWTAFICTFICTPVHYGLVLFLLPSNQSVPACTAPKRRNGDRLQPFERWIFLVLSRSLPSLLNLEHLNSSAVLKHHFATPLSYTHYYLLVFSVMCDRFIL